MQKMGKSSHLNQGKSILPVHSPSKVSSVIIIWFALLFFFNKTKLLLFLYFGKKWALPR